MEVVLVLIADGRAKCESWKIGDDTGVDGDE
jgi:hypothetical protein